MSEQNIFGALNESQYNDLKDALVYITVLIAGADGEIDEQELNWAEKLTHIRTYAKPQTLNSYYLDIEKDFDQRVTDLMAKLPDTLTEREDVIVKKLTGLNEILTCVDNDVAFQLYESFTSFATHIAKASGGFLRFGSISSKEKQWINLPMITPVIRDMDEEE